MSVTIVLKPCPFCGSPNVIHEGPEWHDDEWGHAICCDGSAECMASSGLFETKEEAVNAWNKRPEA